MVLSTVMVKSFSWQLSCFQIQQNYKYPKVAQIYVAIQHTPLTPHILKVLGSNISLGKNILWQFVFLQFSSVLPEVSFKLQVNLQTRVQTAPLSFPHFWPSYYLPFKRLTHLLLLGHEFISIKIQNLLVLKWWISFSIEPTPSAPELWEVNGSDLGTGWSLIELRMPERQIDVMFTIPVRLIWADISREWSS